MIISPSSSSPDLNGLSSRISTVNGTTTIKHRIPRKPAPSLDIDIISELRYPTPDPSDPFAPLWVLRSRTSSALHASILGPYGSQETLANLIEDERTRRRSYSLNLLSSPYSGGGTVTGSAVLEPEIFELDDTDSLTYASISSPDSSLGSPVKEKVLKPTTAGVNTKSSSRSSSFFTSTKAKPPTKIGHYTPYSQTRTQKQTHIHMESSPSPAAAATVMGMPGTTHFQAFPCVSTSTLLPPHFQTRSHSASNTSFANASRKDSDSSGNSDAETDSNSDTYTNSHSKAYIIPPTGSSAQLKPVLNLVRPHTSGGLTGNGQGTGWWFSRAKSSNASEDAGDRHSHVPPRAQSVLGQTSTSMLAQSQPQSQAQLSKSKDMNGKSTPGRFARFLLPRKIGSVRGEKNRRPSTADSPYDDNSMQRSRLNARPVSKASISSPQAVVPTSVFWNHDHGGTRTSTIVLENEDVSSTDMMHDESPLGEALDADADGDGLVVWALGGDEPEMNMEMNTTNNMNSITNATNNTNMNATCLYMNLDHQNDDDNDVSVSESASASEPESSLDHARPRPRSQTPKQEDHEMPETESAHSSHSHTPNDTITQTWNLDSDSVTEKKHNDDGGIHDSDNPRSHGSYLESVLHPLTISELTDSPISADDDDDDGSDTAIEFRRRHSLDIIDGWGTSNRLIAPPTLPFTSTLTLMMASQRNTVATEMDSSTDDITARGLDKKRATSFFRVMTKTKQKPSGPRPKTTEGRLTVPKSHLHAKTLTSTSTSTGQQVIQSSENSTTTINTRESVSVASVSTRLGYSAPSFDSVAPPPPEKGSGEYTRPRPAPQPPKAPAPSVSGKSKSMFLFKQKSDGVRRKRSGRKSGTRFPSVVAVEKTQASTLAESGVATLTAPSQYNPAEVDIDAKREAIQRHISVINTETYPAEGFFFSTEWTPPTAPQLTFAASLPLTSEDGTHVSFGSLFASTRTIVVFIRHFWCHHCQDYMSSLKSLVRPEMLAAWPKDGTEEAEEMRKRLVKFVVVSNGAHGMIAKYRKIFGLPFKVYTDPELKVYRALGMGRDGGEGESCVHHPTNNRDGSGCIPERQRRVTLTKEMEGQRNHNFYQYQQQQQQLRMRQKGIFDSAREEKGKGKEAGEVPLETGTTTQTRRSAGGYVKHGLVGGIAMVVVRALKVGMPVWEKGGDVGQLGGEFVFGPGLKCTYAHRMQNTRGHAPIEDVLMAAGIDLSTLSASPSPESALATIHSSEVVHRGHEKETGRVSTSTIFSNALPSQMTGKEPLVTSIEVASDHPRRRLSRNLTGSISLSRAASIASAISVSLIQKSLHVGSGIAGVGVGSGVGVVAPGLAEGVVEQLQSKRHTHRSSIGFVGVDGVMSRDEEEQWMESRRASIERLREKKDMRRGILRSRTASVDSTTVAVAPVSSPAAVDEDEVVIRPGRLSFDSEDGAEGAIRIPPPRILIEDEEADSPSRPMYMAEDQDEGHHEVEDEMPTPTVTRRPTSVDGEWESESAGGDADHEDDSEGENGERTPNPSLKSESVESLSDSASSWSRSTAPPHDGGNYVFMHDVVL